MKRWMALLAAVLMALTLFAGCSGTGNTDADDNDDRESEEVSEEVSETQGDDVSLDIDISSPGEAASTGNPITDSLTAYMNAKGVVYAKISDGLGNNPDTMMTAFSLTGIGLADVNFMMAGFFGVGQEAAVLGLGYLGVTEIQYSESGNEHAISYMGTDGALWSMTGTWDAAADSLSCIGAKDGVEYFYADYHKTAYGYIAQYYLPGNTVENLYLVAVEGEDGTLGISTVSAAPAALTGSEAADYPASCDEWYAVHGTNITGKTSDGTVLDFEYTPTPSAS